MTDICRKTDHYELSLIDDFDTFPWGSILVHEGVQSLP
jgi:hypothetical protein